MKRHPVGTRVLIIASKNGLTGKTGTVVAHRDDNGALDHCVNVDNDPIPDGLPWNCHYKRLMPIRDDDDDNTVTSWTDCIWQPDGVAA